MSMLHMGGEGSLNAMNEACDLMMEKSKKINNQACNSRNMVYSMCVAEREFSSQVKRQKQRMPSNGKDIQN